MDDLNRLIAALSDPEIYAGEEPVVHQTHISVVFVAGDRAYKLKKPVDLGFVDYSTPQRRRAFCEAEVTLNRRLAPGVYLGVRSVVPTESGMRLADPDNPSAIDWVVEMERLDDDDRLLSHLHAGTLEESWLVELGHTMAAFHASCARAAPGGHGSFETVARNARDNFAQSEGQVGQTVAPAVFRRARGATEQLLARLEPVIRARDLAGRTRDTHGDLRLEHVYRVDERICVIDCIEFNEAFRFADPVADIAFLVMDLRIRWAEEHAAAFVDAYFEAGADGRELLDFYVAYRSAVRAKVHGIAAVESELDAPSRERATVKSRAHWLFTWSTLAPPAERPALVLIGGLPGTGKSTLARFLAEEAGFEMLDTDVVRKELAGVAPSTSMRDAPDTGIYTPQAREQTYETCLERAMTAVSEGRRVVVSATFQANEMRERFLRAAHAAAVTGLMLECTIPVETALSRIGARTGDASDADLTIYEHIAATWEAPSQFVAARWERVSTASFAESRDALHEVLVRRGLH